MQLMESLEYLLKKILSKEEDKGVFKPGSTIENFHIRIILFFYLSRRRLSPPKISKFLDTYNLCYHRELYLSYSVLHQHHLFVYVCTYIPYFLIENLK